MYVCLANQLILNLFFIIGFYKIWGCATKTESYSGADDKRGVEVGGAMDAGEDTGTAAAAYTHPGNGGGRKGCRGVLHVSRQRF